MTGVTVVGTLVVALTLLAGQLVDANNASFTVLIPAPSERYTPLVPALKSVVRLAAEHLAEAGPLSQLDNASLAVVESAEGAPAAASLCTAIGANDSETYAVLNMLDSSSASLIGSLSKSYLHVPILNIRGMAERPDSRGGSGGFLLGMKPGIVPQMKALVRLILDMKLERDALDGRSETKERVWLVYTSDSYGSTAADAFVLAASSYSVALPITGEWEGNGTSENSTSEGQEALRARVEIARMTVLPGNADANFDSEMATLAGDEASIIVLLADGFDPAVVRAIFTQARYHNLAEGVQWFLPDTAAMDHIFDIDANNRDAGLAYDMRGTLGVRTCTPLTDRAATLNRVWQRLDPDEYPGAGTESLTADGGMDPLLAFAYDSVFLAAAAVRAAREEAVAYSGTNLTAIDLDSCPFPVNGSWRDGSVVRDAIITTSSTLEGTTGPLNMSFGDVTDGRDVDGVTFCAVNLRPHPSRGGRFEVIRMMTSLGKEDGEGFQIISPYQAEQTYPAGSTAYPFDRPVLLGREFDVVMRRDVPPFVFVEGDGDSNDDFTGITPEFLKILSERLGFTYSLRAPPAGTSTGETITMVRNGSADMAASWITITAERSENVSFTYPYYDIHIYFIYKPRISNSFDFFKPYAPFENRLWRAILVGLLVTTFLHWLYEGKKHHRIELDDQASTYTSFTAHFHVLVRSSFDTAYLMLSQLTHSPRTCEGYILTIGWLFASFVLAASYTAELTSFLTATKLQATLIVTSEFFAPYLTTCCYILASVGATRALLGGVLALSPLIKSLTVEGLRSGKISHNSVALMQGGNLQSLYERDFMKCTEGECIREGPGAPKKCAKTADCIEMVANGTVLTTLLDSATAEYEVQNKYCELDILPDIYYPQHYGLVLPLDSALAEEFQKPTLQLRENGTLDDLAEPFFENGASCESVSEFESGQSNMSLEDVAGVFFMLAVCVFLSLCSWILKKSRKCFGYANRPSERELWNNLANRPPAEQISFVLEAVKGRLLQTYENDQIEGEPTQRLARRNGARVVHDIEGGGHSTLARSISRLTRRHPRESPSPQRRNSSNIAGGVQNQ